MREKQKAKPAEQPQSQFNLKDGRSHQLGRSEHNLRKYQERQAAKKKNADRGTIKF